MFETVSWFKGSLSARLERKFGKVFYFSKQKVARRAEVYLLEHESTIEISILVKICVVAKTFLRVISERACVRVLGAFLVCAI